MVCPKCGFELGDGQLYCERCGMEIQIVPDFDPEIENSIIETLSTVAEEIELNQQEGLSRQEGSSQQEGLSRQESSSQPEPLPLSEPQPKPVSLFHRSKGRKKEAGRTEEGQGRTRLMISIVSFVGVILLSAAVGIQMYHVYSVPYQTSRAAVYAEAGNYQKAAEYMAKADSLSPENAEIRYTMAGYYYLNQEPDKAVSILVQMTQSDRYTVEEKERCYERAIGILDEQQKYQEISDLLKNCDDEALVTQFQSYLAMTPEFSVTPGNYAEVIPLKLSSNTSGKIYYTLNGSKPTTASEVYTAPIFLQTGDYVVSAMFINDYGIESEIVRNSYHIELSVPDPPQVALTSGLYLEPTLVEVTVPPQGEVYYTVNGNTPTVDSTHYTAPIPMLLGSHEYQFVAVSPEGVSSEVITRNYEFRLMTSVTPNMAIRNIKQALLDRKVLTDMEGKAFGMTGYYEFVFDSVVQVSEKGLYYKIIEYYREESGAKEKTERLYAVEVYTGAPNRLVYNEQGEMDLISLS